MKGLDAFFPIRKLNIQASSEAFPGELLQFIDPLISISQLIRFPHPTHCVGSWIAENSSIVGNLSPGYLPRQPWTQAPVRIRWTISAFSLISSLFLGNTPTYTPSFGLMLSYAVRKA